MSGIKISINQAKGIIALLKEAKFKDKYSEYLADRYLRELSLILEKE